MGRVVIGNEAPFYFFAHLPLAIIRNIMRRHRNLQRSIALQDEVDASEIEIDRKSVLGRGGQATVYAATYKGMRVAAKVFQLTESPEKTVEAAKREFRSCRLLASHPAMISMYGYSFNRSTNEFVLLSERMKETLKKRIERAPLDMREIIALASSLFSVLQHMHNIKMFHRDIKSSNIMYSDAGDVKILDLGLAVVEGSISNSISQSDQAGTILYMAPEVRDMPASDHAPQHVFHFAP